MKNISQKNWFSLSIEKNDSINLDLVYAALYNYLIGSNEINGKYIFYFDSVNEIKVRKIINSKLKNYTFIIQKLKLSLIHI